MKQTTYPTGNGSYPSSVAFGDCNNDSLLDIVVANSGMNIVCISLGYGNGTFATLTSYSIGDSSSPSWIAVDDFNNDNCLDITVVNSASKNILVLLGDGNGTFRKPQSYLLGYGFQLYSMAVGDFNRDSWIDIAVADYGKHKVEILLQACDKP